jgi:protease IV
VLVPAGAVAGDADATSVETNPGQLGLVESSSSALVLNHWGDIPRQGRGGAFLFSAPLIVRGLSMGAGFHWLRRALALNEPAGYYKLQLGGGMRLGGAMGIGFAWERLLGNRYGGLDTLSAGLGSRIHPMLAAGLAVRDITRPRPPGETARVPREWEAEIAFRPLGTYRLELAVAMRYLEGAEQRNWLPRARLGAGIVRGLALVAEVETPRHRTVFLDDTAAVHSATDFRATLGLVATFDRNTVTAAGIGRWRRDDAGPDGAGGPGGSLVLRSFFTRRPAALVSPKYVARLKLAGLASDRAFLETVARLRRLGDDPAVGAVLLQIDSLDSGLGRVEELRQIVASIRQKKPVFAWLAHARRDEYYLASACQRVVMHPAGGLFLGGLAQAVVFFTGALDRLGVNVDLVRIAEYKGAMEPFVLTEHSEPVRENRESILDDVFGRLLQELTRAREGKGLAAKDVRRVLDRGIFTPVEAKQRGLVDELGDERQVDDFIKKALGQRWSVRDADLVRRETGRWRPPRVAVILVDGPIVDGRPVGVPLGRGPMAWSEPIIEALREARRNPSIRAVVLRINSPGGSAFASDRIAREVVRLRESRKPVIVSMADTAASGGYYVAAPADEIYALPSSITGSIGIYSYKVDLEGLMNTLGLTVDVSTRGERADLFSPYRPWTQEERALVLGRMEYFYRQFLKVVADGRKERGVTEARADEIGRGRVFTGAQALDLGLVDHLGGVDAAIDAAARRGNVPTGPGGLPELVVLPAPPPDPLQALLALRRLVHAEDASGPSAGPSAASLSETLVLSVTRHSRAVTRLLLPLVLGESSGIQARMPFEIELR